MNRHWFARALMRYDTIGFLLCCSFFLIWPQFDLQITQNFYDAEHGGFFLRNHPVTEAIYTLTHIAGAIIFIGLIASIITSFFVKNERLIKRKKHLVFLLSLCIFGPGLMVNLLFKDHWGRPRPRQVIEFGGDKQFEPPFAPSFSCSKCKSFVSGHSSVGFYFFGLALLARDRRWLIAPALAGALIGSVRMVQGAHFFSDVLFSGWVVWFCSILLYHWFFKPETSNTNKVIEPGFQPAE